LSLRLKIINSKGETDKHPETSNFWGVYLFVGLFILYNNREVQSDFIIFFTKHIKEIIIKDMERENTFDFRGSGAL